MEPWSPSWTNGLGITAWTVFASGSAATRRASGSVHFWRTNSTTDEVVRMVKEVLKAKKLRREQAEARLLTIDKIADKLYPDNVADRLDNDRLRRMMAGLEKESAGLKVTLAELSATSPTGRASAFSASSLARCPRNLSGNFHPQQELREMMRQPGLPEICVSADHCNTKTSKSLRWRRNTTECT